MKLYNDGELGTLVPQIERMAAKGEGPSYYPLRGQYLLITIEELKDIWQSAKEYRDREVYARDIGKDDYSTAPDFEDLLKQKGIKI